jgi:SAM-dependent methyltransferase
VEHHIHYDGLPEFKVPSGARRVLDVGCGDGFPAGRIPDVTAADVDPGVLERARSRFATAPVRWLRDAVMTAGLPDGAFDAGARVRRLWFGRVLIARRAPAWPGGTMAAAPSLDTTARDANLAKFSNNRYRLSNVGMTAWTAA